MTARFVRALFGLAILSSIGMAGVVHAATPEASPVGITLSPTLVDIDLSKTGTQPEFQLSVRNNLPTTQTFDATSLNITGLNPDGGVAFSEPGQPALRGLSNNLRYEPANITLQPNETKTIKVTIDNPDSLAPGGHYGAAVVSSQATAPSTSNNVAIKQAVTSLIFLTTKTGGVRSVKASAISAPSFGWRLPATVDVVIDNTGNTQTAPIGYISLERKGSVAGQGILNPDRNLILPDQNRIFRTTMSQNSGLRLIGRYNLTVHYQATSTSPEQTLSQSFWYVNPWLGLAFVGLWAAIILGIFGGRKLLQRRHKK